LWVVYISYRQLGLQLDCTSDLLKMSYTWLIPNAKAYCHRRPASSRAIGLETIRKPGEVSSNMIFATCRNLGSASALPLPRSAKYSKSLSHPAINHQRRAISEEKSSKVWLITGTIHIVLTDPPLFLTSIDSGTSAKPIPTLDQQVVLQALVVV
jgi:hypothetical protein